MKIQIIQPAIIKEAQIQDYLLKDDGTFPNNEWLPLLIYKNSINLSESDAAARVEKVFSMNDWRNSWRNGIYKYHHYHSNTHEVLGIYQGEAKVQMGGPQGIVLTVNAGDVVIIPAGVAHKNLVCSSDFRCVGAYPEGKDFDINYGKEKERLKTEKNISSVPLPQYDPVYGIAGPIRKFWI